jgi:methylglutamate dehydrogenase subunit D
MSKNNLRQRSALAGIMTPGRIGVAAGAAGVVALELQGFSAASIIAHKDQVAATVSRLSRYLESPVTDGTKRSVCGSLSVSGVAPGQWFMIERDLKRPSIADLRGHLAGLAVVVDQSDSRFILELNGAHVRSALAKGVPVDLDASVFKPGDVAQTMAAHIGLQVSLMTEQPAFELVSAASTAGSFWSWFAASASEYGLDVV